MKLDYKPTIDIIITLSKIEYDELLISLKDSNFLAIKELDNRIWLFTQNRCFLCLIEENQQNAKSIYSKN